MLCNGNFFYVGPTETCSRGNQKVLTLMLNLWDVVGFSVMVRNSGPTLGIIFWVWVRVRVCNVLCFFFSIAY